MDIRILGAHNAESSETGFSCFIVDDTLAVEAGGLTSRLSIEEQRVIDAVILTHHHMDHIRDIPGIALNMYRLGASVDIYSTPEVCDIIQIHLLNKMVYPEFQKIPEKKPTLNFMEIEPLGVQWIDGHSILPVPVKHTGAAVGYEISDRQGKVVFYTGDTGPDLSGCWKYVSPQLLIIDVTLSNEYESFARETGHLTPRLLEQELRGFREVKGYLPDVLTVHMDAALESVIREELAAVAKNLDVTVTLAFEGMRLTI